MSNSQKIISVGYSVNITPENWGYIIGRIQKERPDIDTTKFVINFEKPIFAGVKYSEDCRGGHEPSILVPQSQLNQWYSKHLKTNTVYFRQLYITPQLVIAEADATPDRFYIVLCNTTGTATTMHKHNIVRGHYGKPIDIERITVNATAYSHTITIT